MQKDKRQKWPLASEQSKKAPTAPAGKAMQCNVGACPNRYTFAAADAVDAPEAIVDAAAVAAPLVGSGQ